MSIAEKIIALLILGVFFTIVYRWGKVVVVWCHTVYDIVKELTGSWKIGLGALIFVFFIIYQMFR